MTEIQDSPIEEEIKRQTVILVFSVLGAIALIGVSTLGHDTAMRHRAVMRTALSVKRFAQWNSDLWTGIALGAGTIYNRYRD